MTDPKPSAPTDGGAASEGAVNWPAPGTTFAKNVPWYIGGAPKLPDAARELLEGYSKIPSNEVEKHVEDIRERAWAVHPYPCIGRYRFLDLSLSTHPAYPRILSLLRQPSSSAPPPLLLDLGCCFGQDLRKLLVDGVPPASLIGAELRQSFVDLGYALFRDAATFPPEEHFVVGDVLDPDGAYPRLKGKVDVLHAASFLHLWNWEGQVEVAGRMVGLMRDKEGVVMLGRDVGNVRPGYKERSTSGVEGQGRRQMWRHDVASCERMWKEVGERTGTQWRVNAGLDDIMRDAVDPRWHDADTRRLVWEVERVG